MNISKAIGALARVGVVAFLMLSISGSPKSHAGDAVVIGVAVPLTGRYSAYGDQIKRGVLQATFDLNESGGLNGLPVVVDFVDDACHRNRSRRAAEDLIKRQPVLVIAHFCGLASHSAEVYLGAKAIQTTPLGSAKGSSKRDLKIALQNGAFALDAYSIVAKFRLGTNGEADTGSKLFRKYFEPAAEFATGKAQIFRLKPNELPCCIKD